MTSPNAHLFADGRTDKAVRPPVRTALMVSIVTHAIALTVAAILAMRMVTGRENTPAHLVQSTAHITWIARASQPGEGRSGSGNQMQAPARPMQRPGVAAVALPTTPPSNATRIAKPADPEPLSIPAVATAAGIQELPGVVAPLTSGAFDSNGPGSGGRYGAGHGSGLGPGDGSEAGTGYRPGNGVSSPRLLREIKPGYTGEAMRARIQGVVRLQAIVLPDGSVGNMKIVRSLDHVFGLDDEALKSVSQWRFQPGTLAGRAVPVLIEVELAFTLR